MQPFPTLTSLNDLLSTTSNLTVSKSAPASVGEAGALVYTIGIGNSGGGVSGTSITIQDELPNGVSYVSATPGTRVNSVNCIRSGQTLTCLATLSSGLSAYSNNGVANFTINTTAPTTGASITNYVSIDPNGGSNPPSASGCTTTLCARATTSITGSSSITGTYLRSNGSGVNNATVQLLAADDSVLASTTTTNSGAYQFNNLRSGTYGVRFVSNSTIKGKAKSNSGAPSGEYIRNISLTSASSITDADAILVDPAGVIYDSVTRQAVPGATVRLLFNGNLVNNGWLDQGLGGPNAQITAANGSYSFVLNGTAQTGTYTIDVTPASGYAFQSPSIAAGTGPYNPGLGGGVVSIQSQATAPTISDSTTYYLDFSLAFGGTSATTSNGVINNHIPIDPVPVVTIENTTNANEATTNGIFTVRLSRAAASNAVVAYNVSGTATAGTDYSALSGSVTVAAGQTSATIQVPVINDASIEGSETVILTLTGVTGGTAVLSSTQTALNATNTLFDDDANNAPVFGSTNALDSNSAPAYSFNYAENAATGATLGTATATDPDGNAITFSITAGNANSWFAIDPSTGVITLTAAGQASLANDFETTPNLQTLTVSASDGSAATTIEVRLNETNVDDTAPRINIPNVGPGSPASIATIQVNEGQTNVVQLTADEQVTWSMTGGSDISKFRISADGTISFVVTTDYENPADVDVNNSYILVGTALDGAGNQTVLTLTVNVLNVDDTAATIIGPSGGPGAAASTITISEGTLAVTTFTATEQVIWSLDVGVDASRFQVNAQTGAINFLTAPDFENPNDSDRNNSYIVRIKATDAVGNTSFQALTVDVANVDEVERRLAEISSQLRDGLRGYAAQGLSDMLGFNEGLLLGADDQCHGSNVEKALSGAVNATESGANARLNYGKRLTACDRQYQVLVDAGATYSKSHGDWNSRLFASALMEAKVNKSIVIGVNVLASQSNDEIYGFDTSSISDKSLQIGLYSRYDISNKLRAGAFAAIGSSNYTFALQEADGFKANGTMDGHRQVAGLMLSGDVELGGAIITTDAVLSRATEKLGQALLSAQFLGEHKDNIAFAVGTVDVTRVSIPLSAPIQLSGLEDGIGNWSKLLLSGGLLCEDDNIASSSIICGYQMRMKLLAAQNSSNRVYADVNWESVSGVRRSVMAIGYARRFGSERNLELGVELSQKRASASANDNAVILALRLTQ